MNAEHPDLHNHIKRLLAENASLRATLDELRNFCASKEKEIQHLKLHIGVSAESKSQSDNQATEVSILHDLINGMEQKAAGAANREAGLEQQIGRDIREHHQMQDLLQQYTALQSQLEDLQNQLRAADNRNLLLQHQTSVIAAQESSLANLQRERDKWKALALLKENT